MGSAGVGVVRGPMDAARAYAALPERHRSDFLIEEFQPGTEYSAEGVFVEAQPQVITLTTKHLMEEADCFIERGHVIPALLPEPVSRRARQVVEAALRALGLVYGVFHVEFWIDGDRIVLGWSTTSCSAGYPTRQAGGSRAGLPSSTSPHPPVAYSRSAMPQPSRGIQPASGWTSRCGRATRCLRSANQRIDRASSWPGLTRQKRRGRPLRACTT